MVFRAIFHSHFEWWPNIWPPVFTIRGSFIPFLLENCSLSSAVFYHLLRVHRQINTRKYWEMKLPLTNTDSPLKMELFTCCYRLSCCSPPQKKILHGICCTCQVRIKSVLPVDKRREEFIVATWQVRKIMIEYFCYRWIARRLILFVHEGQELNFSREL